MPGLSEKIRIDERDKIIARIDFMLYNLKNTNNTCLECLDVELVALRDKLAAMNAEAERN
jgi:hypothetical protein